MQRLWKLEGVSAWHLVHTQQTSVELAAGADMWDARHKANKTDGQVFGALFCLLPSTIHSVHTCSWL